MNTLLTTQIAQGHYETIINGKTKVTIIKARENFGQRWIALLDDDTMICNGGTLEGVIAAIRSNWED